MKHFTAIICILILSAFSLAAQSSVSIGTSEWAPYSSEEMEGYGFISEIVTAAFQAVDIEPEFHFQPWNRLEHNLEQGKLFGIFPYVESEDRRKKHDFTDVIANSTGKFFYYKPAGTISSSFNWNEISDLKPFKVGGTLGYWYEDLFKEAGLTVDYVSSDDLNIRKLKAGRIDTVPLDELVGWQLIMKRFDQEIDNFAVIDNPLNESPLMMMISRDYPHSQLLLEKFNRGMEIIRNEGTFDRILAKYGLES